MVSDRRVENHRDEHVLDELSLFSSQRRRQLLAALDAATTQVSLHTLADVLGQAEDNTKMLLHHVDLPKFADAGLITYYPDRHLVDVEPPLAGVSDRLSALESRAE